MALHHKKSTTDAAMVVKDFIDEALTKGQIVALVSLVVEGAFDSAWWPAILKSMKDLNVSETYITIQRATSVKVRPLFQ